MWIFRLHSYIVWRNIVTQNVTRSPPTQPFTQTFPSPSNKILFHAAFWLIYNSLQITKKKKHLKFHRWSWLNISKWNLRNKFLNLHLLVNLTLLPFFALFKHFKLSFSCIWWWLKNRWAKGNWCCVEILQFTWLFVITWNFMKLLESLMWQ